MRWLSRAQRMLCTSWSMHRLSPLSHQPTTRTHCMITITTVLSRVRMFEMRNSSFSRLDPLKELAGPCCPGGRAGVRGPLPQAMLEPEIHVDVRGHAAARVMLISVPHVNTKAMQMSVVCVACRIRVDVYGLFCHHGPC